MINFYILDDQHNPVPADMETWASYLYDDRRIVAKTKVGKRLVSTVFWGLDHNCSDVGPPYLFETMVFAQEPYAACWRCSTWAEAETQHAYAVANLPSQRRR